MSDKSKLIDLEGLKVFKNNYETIVDEKISQASVTPEQKAIWDAKVSISSDDAYVPIS